MSGPTGLRPAASFAPAGDARSMRQRGTDPRIQARRIAVRRSEGRRRLRRLLWVGVVLTVVAAAAGSTRTALLDVDHVRVEGARLVGVDDVLEAAAAAGAGRGDPLADLDLGAVERAVASLPAVAEVRVERRWPGTVVLAVVERQPVASVAAGEGATAVVAADGVVVDVLDAAPSGLPVLEVAGGTLEPGRVLDAPALLAVAAAMPAEVAAAVAAVAPADDGAVELRLADGGRARLGPPEELGAKLVAVATVLEQVELACLAVLDVRVPSAPAVTRRPGCPS